jgi:hypothetical protein
MIKNRLKSIGGNYMKTVPSGKIKNYQQFRKHMINGLVIWHEGDGIVRFLINNNNEIEDSVLFNGKELLQPDSWLSMNRLESLYEELKNEELFYPLNDGVSLETVVNSYCQ